MNDREVNSPTIFPASALLIIDDLQCVDSEDGDQVSKSNTFLPEILNHIQNLVIRDCNHFSINLVLISHHPNFGVSGNNKSATLVRTIRSNMDSYTIYKLSSRDLRLFLTSISSGDDYLTLKTIFTEAFQGDTKFPENDENGRATMAPSLTFSMHDTKLNFRENLCNLNADYNVIQPYLPMSLLKFDSTN